MIISFFKKQKGSSKIVLLDILAGRKSRKVLGNITFNIKCPK